MRLIIFDIDGTLTQSCELDDRCYVQAVRETLGVRQFETDWSNYRDATDWGIAAEIIERHFGRAADDAELARVRERFVNLLREAVARDADACLEVPGARTMLARLKDEAGCGVALATGAWLESAMLKLSHAGLATIAEGIPMATASDARSRHEIITLARKRAETHYAADVEPAVYVGDGVWDAQAAARLGLPFIGIGRGRRAEQLKNAGAVAVVGDYADRQAFLSAIEDCCTK